MDLARGSHQLSLGHAARHVCAVADIDRGVGASIVSGRRTLIEMSVSLS